MDGLTKEQTRCVYDAVESGKKLNIRHNNEKKESVLIPNNGENEENLYKQIFADGIVGKDINVPPMAQWSILSDNLTYVQAVNDVLQGINVKSVDYRDHK